MVQTIITLNTYVTLLLDHFELLAYSVGVVNLLGGNTTSNSSSGAIAAVGGAEPEGATFVAEGIGNFVF